MRPFLEIGPADTRLGDEWATLDAVKRPGIVDYGCRWGLEPLPCPEGSCSMVYASHVLEHIPWHLTLPALREARRILKPAGVIELHVPDFDVLMTAALEQRCLDDHAEAGVNTELHWMHWVAERLFHFGEEPQWHRACFNSAHLEWCLKRAGFGQIERTNNERGTDHGVINLGMTARKRGTARDN